MCLVEGKLENMKEQADHNMCRMIRENQQLVTDEPVEFEK